MIFFRSLTFKVRKGTAFFLDHQIIEHKKFVFFVFATKPCGKIDVFGIIGIFYSFSFAYMREKVYLCTQIVNLTLQKHNKPNFRLTKNTKS